MEKKETLINFYFYHNLKVKINKFTHSFLDSCLIVSICTAVCGVRKKEKKRGGKINTSDFQEIYIHTNFQ